MRNKIFAISRGYKVHVAEEALRCTRPHWLEWLRKAYRHFDKMPQKIQSEKIVFKIIGWCAEPLRDSKPNRRE